jgi:ribosomal protein S20
VPGIKRDNKAAKVAERKRLRNRLVRRSVKTHIVKARSSIDAGEESAYDYSQEQGRET